jgi:YD repeat-containing protein
VADLSADAISLAYNAGGQLTTITDAGDRAMTP